MTTLTLPIWLIMVMVGTPSLILLVLAMRVAKKHRHLVENEQDRSSLPFAVNTIGSNAFQNDLQALQIDAVFNALSALIETERLKLKSLLCPVLPYVPDIRNNSVDTATPLDNHIEKKTAGIGKQIAEKVAAGETVGEIANTLGISQSEVELAISMADEPSEGQGRRLEAVA